MRTLHVDAGNDMRGGQWQALYLVECLENPILLARPNGKLFSEAKSRNLDVRRCIDTVFQAVAHQIEQQLRQLGPRAHH